MTLDEAIGQAMNKATCVSIQEATHATTEWAIYQSLKLDTHVTVSNAICRASYTATLYATSHITHFVINKTLNDLG